MIRFSLILILINIYSYGQSNTFKKGKIIDSVYVDKVKKESFALYLPESYNNSELQPIVFIFDPMAKGENALANFTKVSDTYGYILVCSNNTRNASYETNFEITNRLFNKVFSLFNINPKRIYTSGFSGGARLATTIAVLTKQIQGVLACGAGFSKSPNHIPYENSFSYAAIVGDLDMNYSELYKTTDFLNAIKVPNQLFVYNFNHRWPSSNQILEAFNWLELEAYRKKIITKDEKEILNLYKLQYYKAQELEDENDLMNALKRYEQIVKNFSQFINIDSLKQKVKLLKKNKTQKKQLKLLESSFKKEETLTEKFKNQFSLDYIKPNIQKHLWWKEQIELLKKNQLSSSNSDEKKMYERLLYKIFALAIETVTVGNSVKFIDQSILCYEICINIYPKYYWLYFKQIENYITKKQNKIALDLIEQLLNSGYKNKEAIRKYKGFDSLKNDSRFFSLTKE